MEKRLDLSYFLRYLSCDLSKEIDLYCTLFGECKLIRIDTDGNLVVSYQQGSSWTFNRYGECLYGGGECVLFMTSEKLEWKFYMFREMYSYLKSTEYPEVTNMHTGESYSVMRVGDQYILEQFCMSFDKPTLTIDSVEALVNAGFVPELRKSESVPTEETVILGETRCEEVMSDQDFEINKTKAIMETILTAARLMESCNSVITQKDTITAFNSICDRYNIRNKK